MKIIKLCYEDLEKHDLRTVISNKYPNGRLALYKGVPNYKTGIPSTMYKDIYCYYEECRCEWCNEVFLKKSNIKKHICSEECNTKLLEWNKQWRNYAKSNTNKFTTIKNKLIIVKKREEKKRKAIRYFELREKGKIGPLYDKNIMLQPYYSIKRASDDPDYLEVQCAYCNKWFKPTHSQIKNIKKFVNGNNKKYSTNFYCTSKHTQLLKKELAIETRVWNDMKIPIEVFILQELLFKRKVFKTITTKRNNYFKEVITKAKIEKIKKEKELIEKNLKMPKDVEGRHLYALEWAKNKREKLRIENPKEFKLRRLFAYSKVRAKEKNIEHTITRKWLDKVTLTDMCGLTKLPFSYNTNIQRNPFGPSIDRIDVTEGYTPKNCRIVLWAVNAGIGHYTEQDLYVVCKAYINWNSI